MKFQALEKKNGIGSSIGVDLRWYKHKEFNKLSAEAKDELRDWQNTAEVKGVMQASRDS